jgi:hypothetical protein
MNYADLEQRMASMYIDMLPQFLPDDHAAVSVDEQERFYRFMQSLYQLAFDQPLLFVPSLHEDDFYPRRFNKASYGKPELQADMQKFIKSMDALLQNMYQAGQGAKVSFNKKQQAVLQQLGMDVSTDLPEAWKWMATRPEANLTAFSFCFFKPDHSYASDIYARLLGEEAFKKLTDWMLSKGYKRFDLYSETPSAAKVSVVYANPQWNDEEPKAGFTMKIRHTGIAAEYHYAVSRPPIFGLCIPGGLKTFLEHFDDAPKQVQKLIMDHTKRCDNCRYCVQTDKTGLRPLACMPVRYEGDEYQLCPYYPGYSYCWTSIDNELADQLIAMLSFMDEFVS